MNLTSDNPFWLIKNGLIASYPALDRNVKCEVAVIGGGITGALISDRLVHSGIDTIVLDRRDIGQGSTCATTGLLQYEIDTHLTDLAVMIGRQDATSAYQRCVFAIDELEDCVRNLPDSCGFETKMSLYLAGAPSHVKVLEQEHAARRACGIEVDVIQGDELLDRFGIEAPAALLSYKAAQVDAYRLTHALFQKNLKKGLRVFDRTEMEKSGGLGNGVRLLTDRGYEVVADRIVFATGYESQRLLKQRTVRLKSTYALVTQPLESARGWAAECVLWESNRPYIYARTTSDRRILIGGEDDKFRNPSRRDARIENKTRRLLNRLRRLQPDAAVEAEYGWAGTFAETEDGLPYIGPCEEFANADFALGFGGNGILFSVIAADVIRDLYRGVGNPDARLFRFGR